MPIPLVACRDLQHTVICVACWSKSDCPKLGQREVSLLVVAHRVDTPNTA